jgi:hypothetical protein
MPTKAVSDKVDVDDEKVSKSKKANKSVDEAKGTSSEVKKPAPEGKTVKKSDDFDDILKEAGMDKKKDDAPKLDKKALSADDFKKGMGAITAKATACYQGTAGTATVRISVSSNGRVARVVVTGAFANTPTGNCVAAAVKGATFPAWEGPPQSFGYSFLLSE